MKRGNTLLVPTSRECYFHYLHRKHVQQSSKVANTIDLKSLTLPSSSGVNNVRNTLIVRTYVEKKNMNLLRNQEYFVNLPDIGS